MQANSWDKQDLYGAFLDGISAISESPEAYRRVRGEVRRIVLNRFPYVLFFLVEGQVDPPEVVVLAFIHERRSPDRWPTG